MTHLMALFPGRPRWASTRKKHSFIQTSTERLKISINWHSLASQ